MGLAAGVAIEPEAQTELADATMEVTGVLCAGVPGAGARYRTGTVAFECSIMRRQAFDTFLAGGVDAIFAISLSEASAEAVMDMWSLWHERGCSNKLTSRVVGLVTPCCELYFQRCQRIYEFAV
jgi:phosphomevalonate kinase